jgi:hypothetical protein
VSLCAVQMYESVLLFPNFTSVATDLAALQSPLQSIASNEADITELNQLIEGATNFTLNVMPGLLVRMDVRAVAVSPVAAWRRVCCCH